MSSLQPAAHSPPEQRRAGVLGSPVAHSLSPILHRAAYRALGLDWRYDAIKIDSSELEGFLDSCDGSWAGVSLTMPLKTVAVSLVDDVDPAGRFTHAVNTVVWQEGRRIGYNTDIFGMTRAIQEVQGDDDISSAAILGAGATARSALASIVDVVRHRRTRGEYTHEYKRDAAEFINVEVFARREDAAAGLVQFVEASALADSVRVVAQPWVERHEAFEHDLVVSTLPGHSSDDLDQCITTARGILMDVAYDPWPAPLTRRWRECGGRAATGDMMLLWQAVEQVRLMTGCEAPVEEMRSALVDSLRARGD